MEEIIKTQIQSLSEQRAVLSKSVKDLNFNNMCEPQKEMAIQNQISNIDTEIKNLIHLLKA